MKVNPGFVYMTSAMMLIVAAFSFTAMASHSPTASPPAPVAMPSDARQVRPGDAPAPTATAPAVYEPVALRDCPGGVCRVPQRGEPTPADTATKPIETPATAKGPVKSVLTRTWNARPVQSVGGRVRGVLGRLRCRGCR